MKKGAIVAIVLSSVLAVGAITFTGISWGMTANTLGEYKNQLEYVYQRNLYELTDNINNIESNLSKLKVSTDSQVQQKYLANIIAEANSAQNNIATLPIEHNAINNTTTFINQLSGFCLIQQQNIANGEAISLDDMDQIASLHTSSQNIKYELNRLTVLVSTDYSIVDNVKNPNIDTSNFNNQFSGLNNDINEYPTLIYDGPFSDSVTNKEIKGLSTSEINAEEALNRVSEWFSGYSVKANGETKGDFETFDFTLSKGDSTSYAQVTKRDGLLLQFSGGYVAGNAQKTEDECRTIAETFASTIGVKDVKAVWSTVCNGFVYVNLTYVVNDVIVYPDMIKVKVSQDNGEVVGWEARSYAYNHIERTNLSPTIDEIQARKALTSDVDVRTCRLAIVPNDYVGETLTYEFMCISEGATYYIYIDAKTGEEFNVLKVVETDDGNLLM